MAGRNWTKEEDEILLKHYPKEGGDVVLQNLLKRSNSSIVKRAKTLNIKFNKSGWTSDQDEILKIYYPIESSFKVAERLKEKDHHQVRRRARKLKIKPFRQWTPDMIEEFKLRYPKEGSSASLQAKMNRDATSLRSMAGNLGVKCEITTTPSGVDSWSYSGYKEVTGSYFGSLRMGAKDRKIPFSITPKDIWDKYQQQKGKCVYSGVDLVWRKGYSNTASVDRIRSSDGYTINNIQIVHQIVNRMKWDLDPEDFLKWLEICYNHSIVTPKRSAVC